jgi:hypothetical protein
LNRGAKKPVKTVFARSSLAASLAMAASRGYSRPTLIAWMSGPLTHLVATVRLKFGRRQDVNSDRGDRFSGRPISDWRNGRVHGCL